MGPQGICHLQEAPVELLADIPPGTARSCPPAPGVLSRTLPAKAVSFPASRHVALFGSRVTAERISCRMRSGWGRAGPRCLMTGVLVGAGSRCKPRQSVGRCPGKPAPPVQGVGGRWRWLGGSWNFPPGFRRNQGCPHLHPGRLASSLRDSRFLSCKSRHSRRTDTPGTGLCPSR